MWKKHCFSISGIMTKYYSRLILILIFTSSVIFAQVDSVVLSDASYISKSSFSGVQIDAVSVIAVTQFGGLVDFDFWNKRKTITKTYSIGLRANFEYYGYFDSGGSSSSGPYSDYSLYARHSIKVNNIVLHLLGGISYHTNTRNYKNDGTVFFRVGAELKYKLVGEYVGIVLKGATSFLEKTTFVGVGLSFGYFN